jgi:hypothetical protein
MIKILKYSVLLAAVIVMASSAVTVRRCAISFSACPETFDKDTIVVPQNVIAILPQVLACHDTAVIESTSTGAACSFFFIIDNSKSMQGSTGSDPTGARFTVTQALLDTIYKKQPNAQVGVSVFQELSYLDTSTTSRFWYSRYFKALSTVYDTQPNQGYMPLLTLNQLYNGVRGIDIIDSLLVTTGNGSNINLRYSPNYTTVGNTNINIGFLAAREAFASTTTAKTNQFIVFLSDGDANRGQNDPGPDGIYYFRDSTKGVPTTFTVFFNSSGTNVPASIQTMTTNIQNNTYSTTNPSSAYYSIQASFTNLMNILLNNVIVHISVPAIPITMVLNNVSSSTYTNGMFVFPDSFFLGTGVTSYSMQITYQYTNTNTGVVHDTVHNITFYVRQGTDTVVPAGVIMQCAEVNIPINSIPVVATLLDTNHDGYLDKIDIVWSDTDKIRTSMPLIAQWIKTLNITTLDGTVINLQAVTLVPDLANKTIHIILNENNSGSTYQTAWKNAVFTLSDTAMSISGRPFSVLSILDGAAPVIKSVCFVPASAADTLRVTFSEPVTTANKPGNPNTFFTLVKGTVTLTDTAQRWMNQGDRILYVYRSKYLNDSESVKEGARPLFPLTLCGDVSIITGYHVASNPFIPGKTVIPASQQDPNHPIGTGTRIEISLIPAIQQDLAQGKVTATISIFDAVGNLILDRQPMSIDNVRVKLFKTWDGKTSKGKYAGGGTYMARIVLDDQPRGKTETIRTSVGVKQ